MTSSTSAEAYINQADTLGPDQKEVAISLYDKAISIDPNSATAYYKKALALSDLGRMESALLALDKAIELDPDNATYYSNKGDILLKSDQLEAAVAVYEKAIQLDPNNPSYYNNKAHTLQKLGRLDEALADYDKAIGLMPNQASYYENKANALFDFGKEESAILFYDKAIELDPTNAVYYYNEANILSYVGQYEAAVALYDKAIELDPNNGEFYIDRGLALCELDKKEAAIESIDKAIQLDSTNPHAYIAKGECLMEMGKFNEAIQAYDEAIKLDPDQDIVFCNKGFAFYQLGQPDEAIKWYEIQAKINPNDWACYAMEGKALLDIKHNEEALEHFQQAINIISQGKLQGRRFIPPEGSPELLNTLEVQLISSIKSLLGIPTLKLNEVKSEELKEKIEKLNKKKDNLELKCICAAACKNVWSQEEFHRLNQRVQKLIEEYLELKADVKDSGMKETAEVKRSVKALEEQDPELHVYYKVFYWTAINLFNVYRDASTGIPLSDADAEIYEEDETIVSLAIKAGQIVASILKRTPGLGEFLEDLDSLISSVTGKFKEVRFNSKAAAINKIIQNKMMTEDEISLTLNKVALVIAKAKKQEMLYPEISAPVSTTKIQVGLDWLKDKIGSLLGNRILPLVELHDKKSPCVRLALQDVTLFMAYLFKNYDLIVNRNETLDKQFEFIVMAGGLEMLLEDVDLRDKKRECCEMF